MIEREALRLAALQSYAVLDSAPEEVFDRLTELAAELFDAPIALVSLIDKDRQWFKSRHGLEAVSTPREWAFCAHAIQHEPGSVMVVQDTLQDPRFCDNPLVTGAPDIRFYAGAVITDGDGQNLGTLCVIDRRPRAPSAKDLARLKTLAGLAASELALRRATQRVLEFQGATERALARLVEQANRARLAESIARLGHWRLDLRTAQLTWSDQMYRLHGLEPGSPLNLDALKTLIHPEDLAPSDAWVEQLIATGSAATNLSLRIVRPGEEVMHVIANGATEADESGVITAVLGTVCDVTEMRRQTLEAEQAKARFKMLADNANDLVLQCDLEGRVMYASPSVERLTGFGADALRGRSWWGLMLPEDGAWVRQAILAQSDARMERRTEPLEYRFRRADGQVAWFEGRPSLVFDPGSGEPVGFTTIVRDVTARRTAEEESRQARREAEAAAAVKAQFLANMSHELRTPLTSILGFMNLAAEQPEISELTSAYLARSRDAGHALLCTVNDVLDFSKLEAGQVRFEPQPIALEAFGRSTLDLFGPQAGAKDLSLTFDMVGPGRVMADPDRLRQVLLNLVGNAIKFTETGGVTLKLRYDDQARRLEASVTDTGLGIAPDKVDTLFKRFSQIDGSLTRAGGTGLGLAICKGLVEAQGGTIGVESALGQGSRFWFSLPLSPAAAGGEGSPEGDGARISPGLRVLVVDDHPANRELARLFLEGVGADVAEAVDGEEAVQAASEWPFDLILMDLRMPRLDGLQALTRIRGEHGPNDRTPILAFTAGADGQDTDSLVDQGFDGVVLKPIDPQILFAAVAKATDYGAQFMGSAEAQPHGG